MVRSDLIVLPEPNIDNDLGLFGGVEPFSVEDFFSQGAVKAFVVSIFPRAAWIDLHRFDPNLLQPVLQMRGNKLGTVVRANKRWLAMFHQQRVQCIQNIMRIHFGSHCHAERLTGVFIQNRQHFIAAPIAKLIVHKVDRPNMVGMCGP